MDRMDGLDRVGPLQGLRVLLVEDSPSIRGLLAGLLRMEGAQVVDTDSGRSAVESLRAQEFDVALSDLGLPDIPGDVLIGYIREISQGRTRVAAVTGYGEPELSRARAAGAEAVLTKPIDWEAVFDFVRGGPPLPAAHVPLANSTALAG